LKRPASFSADRELRLGLYNRFRVFYRVATKAQQVRILVVGVKERNQLFIAEEKFVG
jgi:hypothetical protein